MRKRLVGAMFTALTMALLILDGKTAITGATDGINLCLRTVIPSLFPFFVVSIIQTSLLCGVRMPLLRPIGKLCGIPSGAESILLTGLLGGYPVGAQAVAQGWQNGYLNKEDARRMLGFCSNAGPSFIFGILSSQFEGIWSILALWLIHIISAIIVGILLPGKSKCAVKLQKSGYVGISAAIKKSITITSTVCAWIILFRILIAYLTKWFLSGTGGEIQVIVFGILELANGCCTLHNIPNDVIRFIMASGLLSLGGICVTMQTVAATGNLGLGLYIPGKLLQAAISMLLAGICTPLLFGLTIVHLPIFLGVLVFFIAAFFVIAKKSVAFPQEMVYN